MTQALSRLSRFVGLEGGITAAEALARAETHLQAYRQTALAGLDADLDVIGDILAAPSPPPSPEARRLHALADAQKGVAGVFGLGGLSAAADSLCDLIDATLAARRWDADGVAVHFAAMRLLRSHDNLPAWAETEILLGLKKIVDRAEALRPPSAP